MKWNTKLGKFSEKDFSYYPVLPIDKYIIGGGGDEVLRVIDSESGKEKQTLRLTDYIKDVPDVEMNFLITSGKYIFGSYLDGRIFVLEGQQN